MIINFSGMFYTTGLVQSFVSWLLYCSTLEVLMFAMFSNTQATFFEPAP